MKIQIDTNEKMIAVEQDVNLNEFLKAVRKLFPNGEWKDYSLKTEVIINWSNPIYIEKWEPYVPYSPYYPWITYGGDSISTGANYCVEIN